MSASSVPAAEEPADGEATAARPPGRGTGESRGGQHATDRPQGHADDRAEGRAGDHAGGAAEDDQGRARGIAADRLKRRAGRRREIALAAKDTLGVGMGYLPLGAAFGVLLATSGLDWWWAPVFSVLIYAGSMEFLAIGLVTGGAGLLQVAATTFFVNFRHVFYGLSFPLRTIRSGLGRVYGVHALTDEAYALLATRPQRGLTGTRVLATEVICHLYWLTGSTVGALLGAGLGLDAEGLGFTLTALFVVLTIDAYRAAPDLPTLLIALACAGLALAVAPRGMLVLALTAFVGVLVARLLLARRGTRA